MLTVPVNNWENIPLFEDGDPISEGQVFSSPLFPEYLLCIGFKFNIMTLLSSDMKIYYANTKTGRISSYRPSELLDMKNSEDTIEHEDDQKP